jgi:cytochrome b
MKKMKRILVWDPLVRIFHWLLTACFLIAYILEDKMLNLHVLAGSIVLGLVIFRLIWGVMGTAHSRFSDFACSFRQIIQHLHGLVFLRSAHYIGHTPAGSVMIFLLLAGLMVLTLSGVMLYSLENASLPFAGLMDGINLDTALFIENVHGLIADLLALFILFHVAGVLVESILQKQNLIRAIITGYKTYRKEKI